MLKGGHWIHLGEDFCWNFFKTAFQANHQGDVGGLTEQIRQMREVIELPLTNPDAWFLRFGVRSQILQEFLGGTWVGDQLFFGYDLQPSTQGKSHDLHVMAMTYCGKGTIRKHKGNIKESELSLGVYRDFDRFCAWIFFWGENSSSWWIM